MNEVCVYFDVFFGGKMFGCVTFLWLNFEKKKGQEGLSVGFTFFG